jgi:aspartyl-tRNA(Asn)/glutamyl-tRNA(Gln) amidotransferase subunit B
LNEPLERNPNVNVCPVCMAHPGSLPVINKKAVENVIKVGLALNGEIADFTEFDRKNYFYPDIPKGYQISQYQHPIVRGGVLNGVKIIRVHLEEDTARATHCKEGHSLIDFNRAGVPLMELVTEPVIHDSQTATNFARELQLLLKYLGVSDANMEKGEMRVEANISVSDSDVLGTKVEVKNLNSFKVVEKSIYFEIERQIALLEKGEKVVQETRGWDENKQITFSQRAKEDSHDYRYFPDPDLPKMKLHEVFNLDALKKELPELPWVKRDRFKKDYGIESGDIEIYLIDEELGAWFETVAKIINNIERVKIASNYITSDFIGLKKKDPSVKLPTPVYFAELIGMVAKNQITSRGAKDILAMICYQNEPPMGLAEKNEFLQNNNEEELKSIILKVISENKTVVEEYKKGKESLLMFFVGAVMKESKGSANPEIANRLLKEMLK